MGCQEVVPDRVNFETRIICPILVLEFNVDSFQNSSQEVLKISIFLSLIRENNTMCSLISKHVSAHASVFHLSYHLVTKSKFKKLHKLMFRCPFNSLPMDFLFSFSKFCTQSIIHDIFFTGNFTLFYFTTLLLKMACSILQILASSPQTFAFIPRYF